VLAWAVLGPAVAGSGSAAGAQEKGDLVELAGLKSRTPAHWIIQKPYDPQAYKEFRLEPVNDDKYAAQLTIYSLAKEKADTAANYVKRWKAVFLPPEGKTRDEVSQVQEFKVSDARLTYVIIRGDYRGISGDNTTPLQNFALLGVYLDTAKGAYLVRLFGPAETVAFYRQGFEDWLKAFK
jgi:hypothetical protein